MQPALVRTTRVPIFVNVRASLRLRVGHVRRALCVKRKAFQTYASRARARLATDD